ncbi:MBL fold metallo-hydrolase [Halorarum salinum]|uniref:MBL fold metallo-hydrolase n=1 Tax=Halorarum salinum TaxID=2743089 RepID=A0A7D5QCM8_9EURY|nr:MBL fold metallo-hydrolase [Halobaculum salinum]QLG64316.1 MBL fold metallo-hydrolase [Halobaculum salinum]
MRLRHVKSSTVIVEDGDISVLCDPWMLDGAFYGSWAHYPPPAIEPEDVDVDYIYVSHIHPDHFHRETMQRLDADTPVLIHDYATDFLRQNVERLGFDVQELPHDERIHLGGDLHLNVLGADNCDPEVCGNYFGCGWWMEGASDRTTDGSTQIDSMGVFDDGENVLVNANDCRWPLSERACNVVKERYGEIDMLLMQYSAANFYPQCMDDYTPKEKREAREEVIREMYGDAEGFINALEPRYVMPFAGSYTLSGALTDRNEYVASPSRQEARDHFATSDTVEPDHTEAVLVNSGEWFDVDTGEQSAPYTPVDPTQKLQYIQNVLSEASFPHEGDEMPTVADFEELLDPAYEHFDQKRRDIQWESDTTVLLELVDGAVASLSMEGDGWEVISEREARQVDEYVRMNMDPRLLHRILKGPKYAHFNNAQIGSHIGFEKDPDVYERPLYYSMSFLHA